VSLCKHLCRGNCACERHARVDQAQSPLIGAIVCFAERSSSSSSSSSSSAQHAADSAQQDGTQQDSTQQQSDSPTDDTTDNLEGVGFLLPLAECLNDDENSEPSQLNQQQQQQQPLSAGIYHTYHNCVDAYVDVLLTLSRCTVLHKR
jgi:hypothetical protein